MKRQFNVILFDFNRKKVVPYNIMDYLYDVYNELDDENKPTTREQVKEFIINTSKYQWWSRCEYECIVSSWPPSNENEKIDVHQQVMMNIDIITDLFCTEYEI